MFVRRCFFTYSIETWIRLRTSVIADAKWRHSLRTISAFDDAEDTDGHDTLQGSMTSVAMNLACPIYFLA